MAVDRSPRPESWRGLSPDVLAADPVEVAPQLLNQVLVTPDGAARIVEVEAYWGEHDPASHAHRGPTPRNATMFGRAGLLYVYRSYGIHWCANVVVGHEGAAAAVLLRAGEPLDGLGAMRARRPRVRRGVDLTNGPGKLCAALGIDGSADGDDLLDPDGAVRLCSDGTPPPATPLVTTRVGITRAVERPWRFVVPGSPWASRGRPAGDAA